VVSWKIPNIKAVPNSETFNFPSMLKIQNWTDKEIEEKPRET
jgi:hypothetical protein